MPHWQNWSGKQRSKVDAIHFARSIDDISAVVKRLSETPGKRLRVAGAGHSHAPLVVGADQVLDISALSGVIAADVALQRAKIWGATPIYMLGRTLHDRVLRFVIRVILIDNFWLVPAQPEPMDPVASYKTCRHRLNP